MVKQFKEMLTLLNVERVSTNLFQLNLENSDGSLSGDILTIYLEEDFDYAHCVVHRDLGYGLDTVHYFEVHDDSDYFEFLFNYDPSDSIYKVESSLSKQFKLEFECNPKLILQ